MARVSVKPAPGKAGLAGTGNFNRDEKGVLPRGPDAQTQPQRSLGPRVWGALQVGSHLGGG